MVENFHSNFPPIKFLNWCIILFVRSPLCMFCYFLFSSNCNHFTNIPSISFCQVSQTFILVTKLIPNYPIRQREIDQLQNLESVFRIEYSGELRDQRENTERIWETVREEIKNLIEEWGSLSFPILKKSQRTRVENLLGVEVQVLLDQLEQVVSH